MATARQYLIDGKHYTARELAIEHQVSIDLVRIRLRNGAITATDFKRKISPVGSQYLIDGEPLTVDDIMAKADCSRAFVGAKLRQGKRSMDDFKLKRKSRNPHVRGKNRIGQNWATSMINDKMTKLVLRTI